MKYPSEVLKCEDDPSWDNVRVSELSDTTTVVPVTVVNFPVSDAVSPIAPGEDIRTSFVTTFVAPALVSQIRNISASAIGDTVLNSLIFFVAAKAFDTIKRLQSMKNNRFNLPLQI